MFTSLLVGLDGSVESQVALAQAIQVGRRFRARIVLAHVLRPEAARSAAGPGPSWMEWTAGQLPTEGELTRAMDEMLADAAGAVRRAGLEVEAVRRTGKVIEVLRELAEQVGVVIIGRQGLNRAGSPVEDQLGPDTLELIRRCPRPVLVTGRVPTAMDRVLVAYGGGPAGEGALAYAARFAGITGAHLDVVHIGRTLDEGRDTLARASGALSVTPFDFDLHLLDGDIEAALVDAVTRFGSNVLFVGAHREDHGWLEPSLPGSILRTTDIPVLVHMETATPGARASAPHRRPSH